MLCPACKEVEMLVLEFELVEIDYCRRCGGVWLDSGELELIGDRAGALHGSLLAALEAGEGAAEAREVPRRLCPLCGKRLGEVRTETDPPIVVDRCPLGEGLWFERGELDAVVRAAGAEAENALARFFAELGPPVEENGNDSASSNEEGGR